MRAPRYVATLLLTLLVASCGTGAARSRVLSVSDVVNDAAKYDGRVVTVEAFVRDASVHGIFINDLRDPQKGLNLYIGPEVAWSEPVMEMTRMLLIDRDRDQPLGVVARLTGTLSWRRDGLSLLSVSRLTASAGVQARHHDTSSSNNMSDSF